MTQPAPRPAQRPALCARAQRAAALALALLGVGGCATASSGKSDLREAKPEVSADDNAAVPGQSACASATVPWPALPELDAHIAERMEAGHLPGLSACIVKDGLVAWCGAYGVRSIEGGAPVTTSTPFVWASVSKLITATAVVQLDGAGALSLDDDIDAIIDPSVVHPRAPAAPIRPRAVLAHVGGIDDQYEAMESYIAYDEAPPYSLAQVTQRYFDPAGADYSASLNFAGGGPERRYRYSNMGYALLGRVVEVASGQGFADYTAEAIFEPLGMRNTGWRLEDFALEDLAEPTAWRRGALVPQGHYTFSDYPNGGLRSSAHDMACFLGAAARGGALFGAELLPTEALHAMMAPAFPALEPEQGLGWYYEDFGERALWIGHSGAEEGVASDAFMRQDGSLGFVVVANGDWDNSGALLDIEDALIEAGEAL
jgi:CubicO group peptidase (beta-lactamase class C family)